MLIKPLNAVPNSLSIDIIEIHDHNSEPLKGCKSSNIKLFSAQLRIFSINLNIRQIRIVHSIISGNRLLYTNKRNVFSTFALSNL